MSMAIAGNHITDENENEEQFFYENEVETYDSRFNKNAKSDI